MKKLRKIDQEYRTPIARIIDQEIEYQKWFGERDSQWEDIDFPLDGRTLPADPILDRVERYRTANARECLACSKIWKPFAGCAQENSFVRDVGKC
jgi:hypothetical protein